MDSQSQETLVEVKRKIFTKRAIEVGTVLGGPFVAGFMLSENFKTFSEPDKARNSLAIGTVATMLLVGSVFFTPATIEKKIPNELIPLINGLIAHLIVRRTQAAQIDEFLSKGLPKVSVSRIAAVSALGVLVLALPLAIFLLLNSSNVPDGVMTFGRRNHEIYYDTPNVSQQEVKDLGEKLIYIGFFTDEGTAQIKFKRTASIYEVFWPVVDKAWDDGRAILAGKALRDTLQSFYPSKVVVVNFTFEDFDNIKLSFGKDIISKPRK